MAELPGALPRDIGTFIAAALGNPLAARRSAWGNRSSPRRVLATFVAAAIGLTAIALVFWRSDALWRADHQANEGIYVEASALNPWEPTYLEYAGQVAVASYLREPNTSSSVQLLNNGVDYLRQAAALDGYSMVAQIEYAIFLEDSRFSRTWRQSAHPGLAGGFPACQTRRSHYRSIPGMAERRSKSPLESALTLKRSSVSNEHSDWTRNKCSVSIHVGVQTVCVWDLIAVIANS